MMGTFIASWFIKKEPALYWGDFKEWDNCNECNHLQEFYRFTICPKCGSKDVKKAVARWQSYDDDDARGIGMIRVVRVKPEIRVD